MVWALYETKYFPNVRVKLFGTISNDQEFEDFTSKWLELYQRDQDFFMTFDATDVGFVNPKYAYKMVNFISELKKRNKGKERLQGSYIIYNNFYVKFLLNLIFTFQSPVAPVNIVHKDDVVSAIPQTLRTNEYQF